MNKANSLRVGIFGGSFDPVHNGHIAVAKAAIKVLSLQQLIILPASISPFKQRPKADDSHRLKMLEMAFDDIDNILIDRRELQRPAPSYTVDSLMAIFAENPDKHLFLILGEDAWQGFENWYQWQKILELAEIAVVNRGNKTSDLPNNRHNIHPIKMAAQAASSTEIRQRIRDNKDLNHLLPTSLIHYIQDQQLYV